MKKEEFHFQIEKEQIEKKFVEKGWITVYDSIDIDESNQRLIYSYLASNTSKKNSLKNSSWDIDPGSEGKPSIFGFDKPYKYQSYSEKGIEPFLFVKHFNFNDGHDRYVDIGEEFILYFRLYEKSENKNNRKFYYIDEIGELDEVIDIKPKLVRIKLKYLMEYLSIRKLNLVICFDFMKLSLKSFEELNTKPIYEDIINSDTNYNHHIRRTDFIEKEKTQSYIHGKTILSYDKSRIDNFHFSPKYQYEKFIIGYNENGEELLEDCSKENGKLFKLTYFKKSVLDKYYNEPDKYKVDGWRVSSNFFSLKIDNNIESYVAVFLVELGHLPHKEQLHWKQYNISPQSGISGTYYKTMIEGNWVEHPEACDLFFKSKYESFNQKWQEKFGWKFYKDLAPKDQHIFTSLHIPTSNNIKSFCEQILSLSKLMIDKLNETELQKNIQLEKNDRGITKLEKFLRLNSCEIPEMIIFHRKLYDLRSGLLAHSFSNSNKNCNQALKYFNLETNYKEVAKDIFTKSIWTLNTLENNFLKQ